MLVVIGGIGYLFLIPGPWFNLNAVNPLYVPRNYLLKCAIEEADKGNFDEIHQLFNVFRAPYQENSQWAKYSQKRPDWAKEKAGCSMLSCSS